MQDSDLSSTVTPLSLLQITEEAFALASQGALSVIDVFSVTQRLIDEKHLDIALQLYRLWLDRTESPIAYVVQFNLGVLLSNSNDFVAAEAAYRAAIAQKPNFIEGNLNLGTLLERTGHQEEALTVWRAVLTFVNLQFPADCLFYIQALNNLGRLLEIRKELPEALAMLTLSLKQDPKQPPAITHWIHIRQKLCEWPVYSNSLGLEMKDLIASTSSLAMLSASNDPALQLTTAKRYVEENVLKDVSYLSTKQSYGHERLRIGYLSSDFCSHAVSILTAELYSLHDRSKFEVFGFCWSNEDGSSLRARVIEGMDHHIKIGDIGDKDAAELIRSHEIDILIDLHGLTSGTRHNILSYRPAPVQITWLGFPGPTALPEIDYVLCDPFVFPPELEPFFTEKPLRMPQVFQVNDRQRFIGSCPTRESCGLPEDVFVFCSFNNTYKVTPDVFSVWMSILKQVPNSVLWLVADNETVRKNLYEYAIGHGVASERLIFADRALPAEYLARFQVADLFLDTFPFGGGTTASDALWAGLPILTYSGRTFASRMAGGLLMAVDLPELITFNLRDYENKAVELTEHPERISTIKQQLVDNRLSCALFDTHRFVRDLEILFNEAIDELPVDTRRNKLSQSVEHNLNYKKTVCEVNLYHIAYSLQTLQDVGLGYKILTNVGSDRNDWREYWPIRKFLLEEELVDECYYGFFSPRFQEKTGLSQSQVVTFVQEASFDTDVILFSPQPDMGAFFLNVFEQEELFQPGFIAASEAFLASVGMDLSLASLVMDSRQIVFSNYFVARPKFWYEWLNLNEKLFAICEGSDSELKQSLVLETSYPGAVQRKVFLMERIASLLLTMDQKWRVRAYNTFNCAWSASRLNQFKLEAVLSDALKIAIKEQGFHDYYDAFALLRNRLR